MKAAFFPNNFAQYAINYWLIIAWILIRLYFSIILLFNLNTHVFYVPMKIFFLKIIKRKYILLPLWRKLFIWGKIGWALGDVIKCACLDAKGESIAACLDCLLPLANRKTDHLMLLYCMRVRWAFCCWYWSCFF